MMENENGREGMIKSKSPLICLKGNENLVMNFEDNSSRNVKDNRDKPAGENEIPRTPGTPRSLKSFRSSPRNSPRKISSKLPIRTGCPAAKPLLKDLRLPPDENVTNLSEPTVRVTPEKLMEELRTEVKKQRQLRKDNKLMRGSVLDDEISLSIPYEEFSNLSTESGSESVTGNFNEPVRPRMSLRNRLPIILDAPDLVYEDPLEVARQTLQNTRTNSGYRHVKLVYTTERREGRKRSSSPDPAFSKKNGGITRHFLEEDEESEAGESKILKFDRVLKLFEGEEDEELEIEAEEIIAKSANQLKPALKPPKSANGKEDTIEPSKTVIVHVKRICYEEDGYDGSPRARRKFSNNNGKAKRLKRID